MLTFSLQSGSNGNCIYVEADDVGLLFDAGLSGRQTRERLGVYGRDLANVRAVLLSHRHGDHTYGAGVLARRYRLPIFATPATHHAIRASFDNNSQARGGVRHFDPGQTLDFGSVRVHTIPTPHDAAQSVAFVVEHDGRRLGILTDLGHPFQQLAAALRELDAAYLESNHDPDRLARSRYTIELKARIAGPRGHLSNDEAAELLAGYLPRPKWVALAHLSQENNEPELALYTHRLRLGSLYPLTVAGRNGVSALMHV